jgi:lipid-A-disaccharide synthase
MADRLMIVAGEASGDKHGARLVNALRAATPARELEFFGSGGDEMRAAGVETLVDAREMAIMGALEITRALPRFLGAFRTLRKAAAERRPALVILVDWPEFNLRLARRLKKDGHRIVYYISPQVWAWRSHRVNAIKRDVERMLVILPFERDFYAAHGVKVEYVGHPLLDSVRVTKSREQFCEEHRLDNQRPIVALLPGSRASELRHILSPLLEAARILSESSPEIQFVLPLAPSAAAEGIRSSPDYFDAIRLVEKATYDTIAAADLVVVASGTATLEAAIIGTPMIVVYKASALNWRIFHPMIQTKFVGLPNLIAGRQIVPELLQDELNAEHLAAQIRDLLGDKQMLERQREELQEVTHKLGEKDASKRAAQSILDLIDAS